MPKSIFALQLQKRIAHAGITQNVLAEKTGIPVSRMRTWFIDDAKRKPVTPNIPDMITLAKFFETTVEDLWAPLPVMKKEEIMQWVSANYDSLSIENKQHFTLFIQNFE